MIFRGGYIQMAFFWNSQVGVPKLGLLLSQNFKCSYLPQIKHIWSMWGQQLITLKNIFPTVYCTPQSKIIWPLFYGDLWLGVKCHLGLLHKCNSQSGSALGSHWIQSLTLCPACEGVFHSRTKSLGLMCLCIPHIIVNLMLGL